ncbi:MAG: signal peptide peptidase SppA [Gammaproteobacteria bacterium]
MSEPKSLLGRVFGWIGGLIALVYRLIVIGLFLVVAVGIWLAVRGGPVPSVESNIALVIYPSGQLVDAREQDPTQRFFEQLSGEPPSQTPVRDLTDALEKGADDPRISVAVLKLVQMWGAGFAQAQEIATAVKKFRAAGKPVYAYGPGYDQASYLMAAQAETLTLDPMGMVLIEGLDVYQNFFKEGLDKLGVNVHIFRVGEYKSAVEPFERNDMSAEAKEANLDWLGDLWLTYRREAGAARKLPDTAVQAYVETMATALTQNGGDAAGLAKAARLIDEIETQQEFRARVAKIVGWDDERGTFRQVNHTQYLDVLEHERGLSPPNGDKIVELVVAQGEIVDGDSEPGLAGADTIARQLAEARLDDDVAAVVLRIDSPGGSVFASERIRREVKALQADRKPVVVSMGNVAASGGYWIAMDADEIWAHDTTITGSIGIFALLPTFEKPLAKMGIHTDGVGTTPLAGAFRADRPLSPDATTVIQTQLEQGYKLFTEGVAAARELPIAKVQEIARGRVWSGADAIALGLVDQVGNLNDAIAAAARLARLEPDAWRLREAVEERPLPLLRVLELVGTSRMRAAAKAWLPEAALKPVERVARKLRWLSDPRGLYAHCFCTPSLGHSTPP